MKNLILFALVLVTGSLTAQTARLQLIHNSPETTVDIYVNDALLLNDFVFRTATAFVDVAAGTPVVLAVALSTSTSSADSIFTLTKTFNAGESYVAIASGVVGDAITPFNIWVEDNVRETALTPGTIDFFGINGSINSPSVDILVRDMVVLFDDVAYGDISEYRTIPTESYILDVTASDNRYNILGSFETNLTSLGGTSAVLFASGYLGGIPSFGLYAALANGTVVEFPVKVAAYTNLQIIHNSPSSDVDVYVNNTLLLDNFSFRTATTFVPVQAFVPVKIDVAPAGSSSVDDAFYTLIGKFTNPANDYVAVATGVAGDASTPFNIVLQGNIRQSNPSSSKIAIVAAHGSPDAPAIDIVAGPVTLFDNLAYDSISRYTVIPAANYEIDINTADGSTTVISFDADLSTFGGLTAVVFASGFLSSSPSLGLYAALPDGTVVEFPVASERLAGDVTFEGLFPTVADDQITLTLSGTATDQVGVTVYNAAGQVVIAEAANVDNGRITHSMNVSSLAPGQYFVTVYTQEGPHTERFVIAQ